MKISLSQVTVCGPQPGRQRGEGATKFKSRNPPTLQDGKDVEIPGLK